MSDTDDPKDQGDACRDRRRQHLTASQQPDIANDNEGAPAPFFVDADNYLPHLDELDLDTEMKHDLIAALSRIVEDIVSQAFARDRHQHPSETTLRTGQIASFEVESRAMETPPEPANDNRSSKKAEDD